MARAFSRSVAQTNSEMSLAKHAVDTTRTATTAGNAQDEVDALTARVVALEAAVLAMAGHEARIDALETGIADHETRITALEGP